MFQEISQNSQENTFARVSFVIKLQVWGQVRNLWEPLFLQNISSGCLCRINKLHNCVEEICLRSSDCCEKGKDITSVIIAAVSVKKKSSKTWILYIRTTTDKTELNG